MIFLRPEIANMSVKLKILFADISLQEFDLKKIKTTTFMSVGLGY